MTATVWWDPTNGNNANNGLTKETARKYLRDCRQVSGLTAGGQIILVNGHHYHTLPDRNNQDDVRFKNGADGDPIVIRGETPGEAILDADDIPNDGGNADQFLWFSSVSYWTLQDITVKNVNFQRGIRIENCTHINFSNVLLEDIFRHGLRISGDYITIQNCIGRNLCMNNVDFGLFPDGGWDTGFGTTYKSGSVNSTNISFIDCEISQCWGEGLALFNCDGFEVDGCTIDKAISVNYYVSGSRNGSFTNNIARATDADYQRGGGLQRAFSWAAEAEGDLAPVNIAYTNNRIYGGGLIDNAFNYVIYGSPSTWNNQWYDGIEIEGNRIENINGYGVRAQATVSPTNSPATNTFQNNRYKGNFTLTNLAAGNLAAWSLGNNNKIQQGHNNNVSRRIFPVL